MAGFSFLQVSYATAWGLLCRVIFQAMGLFPMGELSLLCPIVGLAQVPGLYSGRQDWAENELTQDDESASPCW